MPGLTALSFQIPSTVAPGFSEPKSKVLRLEVVAPPRLVVVAAAFG